MKAINPRSSSTAAARESAPTMALERPQGLKKWSSELVKIVSDELGINRENRAYPSADGKIPPNQFFDSWKFDKGSLTKRDLGRILTKMTSCGSLVELRSAVDKGTGEVGCPAVHAANFCGQHTICPYCAGRVQDRRGARFRDPILAMARKFPYAYMLTATVPPVETWREDLTQLIKGWQNFRRMGQVRRRKKKDGGIVEKRGGGEWGKIRAGLAKVELKRGSGSELPHCHYHALVFTDERIDFRVWDAKEIQKEKSDRIPLYKIESKTDPRGWVPGSKISHEWNKATKGAINIEVSPLKYREFDRAKGLSYSESIFEQSREVLKYATKFEENPKKECIDLFVRDFVGIRDATYSRRLFSAYGEFRGVGGNDFAGDSPTIMDDPIIYESRWQGFSYSALVQRSRPIFPNMEGTPAVTEKLQVLNLALGSMRRMRSAVLRSRNDFFDKKGLHPAFYELKTRVAGGGFESHPRAIELPSYLVSSPNDLGAWEMWMDEVIQAARAYYDSVRENLGIEDDIRVNGSQEEQKAEQDLRNRLWMRSKDYSDYVTKLFHETLLASREMWPLASPVPPS